MAQHEGPKRVQLRRARGWRKPPGVVVVARPSRWGNPFVIGAAHPRTGAAMTREETIELYRTHIEGTDLTPLRGHDLACWCRLDVPCHADVLLDLANR